jgi:hypothetical protein
VVLIAQIAGQRSHTPDHFANLATFSEALANQVADDAGQYAKREY